jgi:hypothetical protein
VRDLDISIFVNPGRADVNVLLYKTVLVVKTSRAEKSPEKGHPRPVPRKISCQGELFLKKGDWL